jgi:hypothetical protein
MIKRPMTEHRIKDEHINLSFLCRKLRRLCLLLTVNTYRDWDYRKCVVGVGRGYGGEWEFWSTCELGSVFSLLCSWLGL